MTMDASSKDTDLCFYRDSCHLALGKCLVIIQPVQQVGGGVHGGSIIPNVQEMSVESKLFENKYILEHRHTTPVDFILMT